MQFLHLYYNEYPAGDDPKGNRVSYPYAVRIPDKEERVEFEEMLERDGFECVIRENGYPVIYVNFTLERFGNAVKAVASSTIDGGELHEREEFMEKIYNRYMTDETFRNRESNNYALSAALTIVGSVRNIIRNKGCSDYGSFVDFNRNEIEESIAVIRDFIEQSY